MVIMVECSTLKTISFKSMYNSVLPVDATADGDDLLWRAEIFALKECIYLGGEVVQL